MQEFLDDIWKHIQGYYYKIIDLTPKLLLAIIILMLAWFIASRVKIFADSRLKSKMHDPLLATFIANLIKSILIIIGIFFMFKIVGLNSIAGSVLAGAGISAFIIGFALKDIGENFLAGILLAFKRPFTVGDIIESNGVKGKVISLNLRDTQIKSDGKDIYIPNALLIKNTLTNYNSGGYLLQELIVGLEYGSDYAKAIEITKSLLHYDEEITEKGYTNTVVISGVHADPAFIQLSIRYWVKTDSLITDGRVRSEIIIKIMTALKENGFNIK
ncbi:mechanosensitive ion channel family protein [Flavobacterium sp. 3HN19-14]|uniref:mechanosensitive ion channel family protein n=1 Tax=Flavobacterium sp. 3HN19-14 TaxID=3448133 RepID=UPI003EE21EC9